MALIWECLLPKYQLTSAFCKNFNDTICLSPEWLLFNQFSIDLCSQLKLSTLKLEALNCGFENRMSIAKMPTWNFAFWTRLRWSAINVQFRLKIVTFLEKLSNSHLVEISEEDIRPQKLKKLEFYNETFPRCQSCLFLNLLTPPNLTRTRNNFPSQIQTSGTQKSKFWGLIIN